MLFLCFLVNLSHKCTKISRIVFLRIFNSHENTACLVFIIMSIDSGNLTYNENPL